MGLVWKSCFSDPELSCSSWILKKNYQNDLVSIFSVFNSAVVLDVRNCVCELNETKLVKKYKS